MKNSPKRGRKPEPWKLTLTLVLMWPLLVAVSSIIYDRIGEFDLGQTYLFTAFMFLFLAGLKLISTLKL